jgi:RHS repeat-associated protein
VTTADGAHLDTAYSGNQVTVTDQAVKKRRSETDALGRMTKVIEDPGGFKYETRYFYDALDNLRQVTQGSQTRTFEYDSLSRLVLATNPENGPMSYAYDPNGNLTDKTDARGVKTTIVYDALNRAISKNYSRLTSEGTAVANATVPVRYFYDGYSALPSGAPTWPGTPSKGRLTGVTYGSGSDGTYYKYDVLGRIATSNQRQGTANYATIYEYNLAGNITNESRGTSKGEALGSRRRNLQMMYDEAGRLSAMDTIAFPFTAGNNLVRDISYTPLGGLQSETYGNGLIHSISYNERHQPTEIRLGGSGNLESMFRLGYIFGTASNVNGQDHEITLAHNNGNIARIKYFISGTLQHSQTFQYDPLNRLGYAVEHNNGVYNDTSRAWYQKFAYDRHGNRGIDVYNTSDNVDEANNALKLTDFSEANNRITRAGFVYDAVGNLIEEPGKIYTYDAENRMVTATVGGVTSQCFYDGIGRRIRKVVGGVATRFEYGAGGELIAERNESNGSLKNDYFYSGGQLLASTKTGTTYEYATADHLGSPRVWTDHFGNLIAGGRHDYLPFGEELFADVGVRTTEQGYASNTQQDGQRKRFTSQERDPETELDFFVARYYSSKQGRFTTPDSLGGRRSNPQTLNLYAYVKNNPLKYIDPTGHDPQDPQNNPAALLEIENCNCKLVTVTNEPRAVNKPDIGSHIANFFRLEWQIAQHFAPLYGGIKLRQTLYDNVPAYKNYWDTIHSDQFMGLIMSIPGIGVVGGMEMGAMRAEAAMGEMGVLLEVAGSIRNINPTRGMMNCVNCAIAVDATLAGRPASALPGGITKIDTLEKMYGGTFTPVSGPMEIGSFLRQSGNGSRGIVFGQSLIPGQPGHVWNAVNQSGNIRFLDGQTGGSGINNFNRFQNFEFLRTHKTKQ